LGYGTGPASVALSCGKYAGEKGVKIHTAMTVKPGILSCYKGIYKVRGDLFKLDRRAVFLIVLAYQFAVGCVNFRSYRKYGAFNVLHVRRISEKPQEVKFNRTKENNYEVNEYDKISQKPVAYTSEHWVKMKNYGTIS
jgi:hypothetical protein